MPHILLSPRRAKCKIRKAYLGKHHTSEEVSSPKHNQNPGTMRGESHNDHSERGEHTYGSKLCPEHG